MKLTSTFFDMSSTLRLAVVILGLLSICAPNLQAQIVPTQTDEIIINPNGNGTAEPGEQIRYKVTIQNTGAASGTNVQLNVVPDPRTTFVPGSFRSSPLAVNDAYAVTGNVGINVPAASGVKANDFDDNIAGANITAGTFSTTQPGGSIMINADGSFMYTPPAGFTGTDTYIYTLTDGNPVGGAIPTTDMATITFTVSNLIWFIDNSSVAATSDGRVTSPFKSLADFNAGSTAAASVIYIEQTGTNYTGGIVLQDNERLFGEGHTGGANLSNVLPFALAANSKPLPNISGTRPVITNSGGDGVTLAMNNTLRGFDVGNCSGFAINNNTTNSVGNLTISEVTINNTTGGGFDVSNGGALTVTFTSVTTNGGTYGIDLNNCTGTFAGGTGTITNPTTAGVYIKDGTVGFSYGGLITTNSGFGVDIDNHDSNNIVFSGSIISTGMGIRVQNCGGGTISFLGASKSLTTGANTAVDLVSNTGASIDFTAGTLTINTSTGTGLNATGGGILNIAGGNTITKTGNGAAININGVNAGASTISFSSVNVTGGTGTAITIITSTGVKSLGDVDVARSGGGSAIVADGAGTINTTDGTINTGNQIAFDINNTVLGMVFTTVSVNGATKGMEISNTTGSFTINGTSTTDASGGTIQNISLRGVDFQTATNITLKNMAFNNANTTDAGGVGICDVNTTLACNGALYFRTITTLVLTNIDVNGVEEQGLNGSTITGMTMSNCSFTQCGDDQFEGSMKIRDLQGTCSITNSTFTFPEDEDVEIFNSAVATALVLTVADCTFSDNFDNPIANSGLYVKTSTATNTVLVDNSTFLRLKGQGVIMDVSGGTLNANVTDCIMSKDTKRFMAGVQITSQGTGVLNANVNRNTITMAGGIGVAIQGTGTSTFNARVNDNVINGPHGCADCADELTAETLTCSCTGQGITIFAVGTSTGFAEVLRNTITGIDNAGNGVATNAQSDGTLNVQVSNNTITIYGDAFFGIDVLASGPVAGGTPSVCALVSNNTVNRNELSPGSGGSVHFRARASGVGTSVNLQGPGGPIATNWNGNGNMPTSPTAIVSSSGTGTITYGGSCTFPTHPTALIIDPSSGSWDKYPVLHIEKTGIAASGDAESSALNK